MSLLHWILGTVTDRGVTNEQVISSLGPHSFSSPGKKHVCVHLCTHTHTHPHTCLCVEMRSESRESIWYMPGTLWGGTLRSINPITSVGISSPISQTRCRDGRILKVKSRVVRLEFEHMSDSWTNSSRCTKLSLMWFRWKEVSTHSSTLEWLPGGGYPGKSTVNQSHLFEAVKDGEWVT